jgi:hypothetical protein
MHRVSRRELLKHTFVWAASTAVGRGTLSSAEAVAGNDISARERAAMARVVEAFREKYGVPGLALAIAHEGRLAYDEAFGFAERERREVLTTRHRFRIASVSKPITSCAILALVETGRLKLDDRLRRRGRTWDSIWPHAVPSLRRRHHDWAPAHAMTAPTTANRGYAKGWSVNAANNWWHSASLPGTATILVRTASGFCWAALTNTRRPASVMDLGLDNMVWDVVRQTDAWRSRR